MSKEQEQHKAAPPPFISLLLILSSYYLFIAVTFFINPDPGKDLTPLIQKYLMIFGEISLMIVPVVYILVFRYSFRSVFRLRSIPPRIFGLMIPLGISMALLVDEMVRLIELIFPTPEEFRATLASGVGAESGYELFLAILGIIIMASVIEELIFRGLLQQSMENFISISRAVVYASLTWAILHSSYNIAQAVPLFLFSFMLGYLAFKTQSIIPAIICHGINNCMAVLFYNIEFDEIFPGYDWGGHVSPLLLAPALLITIRIVQYLEGYYQSDPLPSSSSTS